MGGGVGVGPGVGVGVGLAAIADRDLVAARPMVTTSASVVTRATSGRMTRVMAVLPAREPT